MAFVSAKDVCRELEISRASLTRMIESGSFPAPQVVALKKYVWHEQTVLKWMKEKFPEMTMTSIAHDKTPIPRNRKPWVSVAKPKRSGPTDPNSAA